MFWLISNQNFEENMHFNKLYQQYQQYHAVKFNQNFYHKNVCCRYYSIQKNIWNELINMEMIWSSVL